MRMKVVNLILVIFAVFFLFGRTDAARAEYKCWCQIKSGQQSAGLCQDRGAVSPVGDLGTAACKKLCADNWGEDYVTVVDTADPRFGGPPVEPAFNCKFYFGCWCGKGDASGCVHQTFLGSGTLYANTAKCDTLCAASGTKKYAVDFDSNFSKHANETCKDYGCWCYDPASQYCENPIRFKALGYNTETQCRSLCKTEWYDNRGYRRTGGQMAYFDDMIKDRTKDEKCLPPKPLTPTSTPDVQNLGNVNTISFEERIKQLKAQAGELNQLGPKLSTPQAFIGQAIRFLMSIMGSLMLLMMVYAGILWMTASGNSEQVEKAKKIMLWSVLGVAVMLSSYLIVNFIFGVSGFDLGA